MKKQVLVTGANKGIGYEIARHLGKSGWQVVVGARCEDRALKAMEALRTDGADVAGWQYVNLADNGEIEVSAREIAEKYPGLSLLVNNAGIPGDMSVRSYEQSLQDVIDTVQVNYIGTFYLTKLLLPLLEKNQGRICNITVPSTFSPYWHPMAYVASKAGQNTMIATMGWEFDHFHVPVEAFTIHPGVIDFKGKTYFFYHNGQLPGGGGFNRSVCVEELKFNKDGSIPQLKMTEGIIKGITTLNPYVKTEAETIAFSEGFKSFKNDQVGVFVTAMKNGSYTCVRGVDFKATGATKFSARIGTTHNDPVNLEIRLDGVDGQLIGTMKVPRTGGSDRWDLRTIDITKVTGVHDLYFIVKGRPATNLMYFDYWMFSK